MSSRTVKSLRYNPYKIPPAFSGMRIGLFGGSFNPPHTGHVGVSEMALRRLNLHQLWWMVTPGNPLKNHGELRPIGERIQKSLDINSNPSIRLTAFEQKYGTRYTADSLRILSTRSPDVKFVWIMGADNLAQFHKWERWPDIANNFPIAVFDRPGSTMAFHSAKFARVMANNRIDESDAGKLADHCAPVWTFIHGPRSLLSSTNLRNTELTVDNIRHPPTILKNW